MNDDSVQPPDDEQQPTEAGPEDTSELDSAVPAQLGAQRQHDIEHHPDPSQVLAGEGARALVGVDDTVGGGQGIAMVIEVPKA